MRLASAVTLINVLVATGFSIFGLVRPDLIVPAGTMASGASAIFAMYAAAPSHSARSRCHPRRSVALAGRAVDPLREAINSMDIRSSSPVVVDDADDGIETLNRSRQRGNNRACESRK